MGLFDQRIYTELKEKEKNIAQHIKDDDQPSAFYQWQEGLSIVNKQLGITNIYDISRTYRDMTEDNYVNFLQHAHIRKALHVGETTFKNGNKVIYIDLSDLRRKMDRKVLNYDVFDNDCTVKMFICHLLLGHGQNAKHHVW